MEIQGKKHHLEFDMARANRAFATAGELEGEQIASPFDLFSVEALRKKHKINSGAGFASDVFVWGTGRGKKPYGTKLSGVPYWPKNKEWPTTEEGEPMVFLAQFCFLDSSDLVPKLPGDVLAIFVPENEDQEWLWENDLIHLEWLKVKDQPLIEKLPAGAKMASPNEWHGVIYRTRDFPEVESPEGISQAYNLPILNGTKIGGVPHGIQSAESIEVDEETGLPQAVNENGDRFLCQLTSVQAAPAVAFPWTNREEPLTLEFDENGIYDDANQFVFGDMGSLYIFIDEDGECSASMECY